MYDKGIQIQNNTKLNTLLYADDKIITSNSDENLQRGVFILNNILKSSDMKFFLGQHYTK
jgi:aromatic ring-opening dioxygenase LigB subunit